MKKTVKVLLCTILTLAIVYISAGTGLVPFSENGIPENDSILITTHWKQMGGFEKQTPDQLRVGCWSTALAQIMYFHRLKPFGQVSYTSSKGYRIDEQLDSNRLDLHDMTPYIDSTSRPEQIDALSWYSYYAALAVRKDFGTDNYMNKLTPAKLIEEHYRVRVSRYISWQRLLPYSSGKLKKIIRREIHNRRPVFLHFANLSNFGHSVVIDGYRQSQSGFMVHLNQGQGGAQDGWYDFDRDLLAKDDRKLRVIYTIKPG